MGKRGKFGWPTNISLSDSCKDFISSLLRIDIKKRMDTDSALKHELISTKGKALDAYFGDSHLNQINAFSTANKLQKILIDSVLSEMEQKEKKTLLTALRDVNMNGNGIIDENDVINYVLMHDQWNKETNTNLNVYGICSKEENDIFSKNVMKKSGNPEKYLEKLDVEGLLDEIYEEVNDEEEYYSLDMMYDGNDDEIILDAF